jgi:3-methyladenine DNA glycosylase AlkD
MLFGLIGNTEASGVAAAIMAMITEYAGKELRLTITSTFNIDFALPMPLNETCMHSYLLPIITYFKNNATANNKEGAEKYMLHQFEFFGVKAPVWRKIIKQHFKKSLPAFNEVEAIVHDCFAHPMREMQYTGIELLTQYKKEWNIKTIRLIEYIITNKSWWDTVDHATAHLCAVYFKQFPEQKEKITGKWNHSANIWLQRCSILFQLKYKKETDVLLLSNYINHCASSKEFFIQKAIGWSLREYAKTNPNWVKMFVQKNALSPLSKREALKRIEKTIVF